MTLRLNWIGPFAGGDVIADQPPEHIPTDIAGVYLHTRADIRGKLVSSYVGKSQRCVLHRQLGHFNAVANGKYNIVDEHGVIVFRGGSSRPLNYISDIAGPYLRDLDVYFAAVIPPHGEHRDLLIDAVEGLLISSPTRLHTAAISLNHTRPKAHEIFSRLEVSHSGEPVPVGLFGPQTIWDRQLSSVIA